MGNVVSTSYYCPKFQTFYNYVTNTSSPLTVDGVWGVKTEAAYIQMGHLIDGSY